MPADMAPSPMTAMALSGLSASLLATAKPSAALIDVELWAAPKGSYALSARLVNPESPPPCRRVRMRSRRPVRILCGRSEEHTSELQSLMRISYAVFCLKKKNNTTTEKTTVVQNAQKTNSVYE